MYSLSIKQKLELCQNNKIPLQIELLLLPAKIQFDIQQSFRMAQLGLISNVYLLKSINFNLINS
jgi:hypothetical protein